MFSHDSPVGRRRFIQLAVIAVLFPLLLLLGRRWPRAALWATGTLPAGVAAMCLVWFVQRVAGS